MKKWFQIAFAFSLIGCLLTSGNLSGQESEGQKPPAEENTDKPQTKPAGERPGMRGGDRGQNMRRPGNRGRNVEVLDPKGFVKKGQEVIFSGPQPGETLSGFEVTGLAGEQKGKTFDPIKSLGDKPLVLVFQDETPGGVRGLLQFSRVIAAIAKGSESDLQLCSVFLDDDKTKIATFADRFSRLMPSVTTLAVSNDGRDGPGVYGLNRNVAMTIIVAKDGKVLHNFVFTQPMLYPDPHVLGAIAEQLGEDRESIKAWVIESFAQQQRMRKR